VQRYVAFIGGLPTGRDAPGMDNLKVLLSRLGFLNVETFLTTGNVIFDTAPVGVIAPLEGQIERYLSKSLDVEGISVFIRTPDQLLEIMANVPFSSEEVHTPGSLLFVVLLADSPDEKARRQLRIRRNEVDELKYIDGREIYWLRKPSNEAVEPPSLAEILDAPATVRTFHTIARLVDRCTPKDRGDTPAIDSNPDSSPSAQSRQ
jgi:uncharacterized protein (DUF1697 family)